MLELKSPRPGCLKIVLEGRFVHSQEHSLWKCFLRKHQFGQPVDAIVVEKIRFGLSAGVVAGGKNHSDGESDFQSHFPRRSLVSWQVLACGLDCKCSQLVLQAYRSLCRPE